MNPASSSSRGILLAHSYYLRYDDKQTHKMKPYPPLATMVVAAVLRERGYSVQLFDAMLSPGTDQFASALQVGRPWVVGLIEDNFNFLTKMCTLRMREAALEMVRLARAAGAKVVVNGSDASDHPELFLASGADAIITGDPEPAMVELLELWSGSGQVPLELVPGLVLAANGNGGVHRTVHRQSLTDLDALPLPAWDLVDPELYRRAWVAAHGRLSWNVVTSRGCPYRCNWCAKPLFGTRYAQRSPANVAAELRELKDRVGPDHVWFADDIFGLTPGWIESFAREVKARGARLPFSMQSRVNLMTPRVVDALAEAGAEEVWLGVESGSQRILDAMDKGTTVAQVRAATRQLRARGIRTGWFVQLGYRGEQWSDIVQTRDLVTDEWPDEVGVSVAYPLPGTKFFDQVRGELGPKANWEDSDDLDMMFHGTYLTSFYKRVRDVIHAEVRSRQRCDPEWQELASREATSRTVAPAFGSP
ncbi:MAG TPA: radical SAM protein [Gemmatimonadales bacterium]